MAYEQETMVCALCGYTAEGRFTGDICPQCGLTFWKCGKCEMISPQSRREHRE